MARFSGGKAPFLRISDLDNQGTKTIMRDFMIGLLPVVLFAWYKNGIMVYIAGNITFLEMLYPLVFMFLGGFLSVLYEAIFFYVTDKEARNFKGLLAKVKVSYGLFPGLILALLLPLYTPIWVLMFGCFMATIVGKMLFGGFGYNIFNPAVVGRVAIMFTLLAVVNAAGGFMNGSEVLVDSYAGATPLTLFSISKQIDYQTIVAPYGNLWDFFIGTIPGSLGETSFLFCLVSYIWLSVRKVINWSTPLIYVLTVFILSWLIGIANGDAGIWFPLYSIFSGGVAFGAVFMATEPVTTPRNPLGKVFFALFIGALTVLFRFIGVYPEGVATSIIVMNIFTIPLDNVTASIRVLGVNKRTFGKLAFIVLLLVAVMVYAVLKSINMYSLSAFMIGGLI